MRRRGELIERSFAHLYDNGGMRRTHLRGHTNILKRLLIHAGGVSISACCCARSSGWGRRLVSRTAAAASLSQF
jgi:transposase